ncbi:MAG TPA: transcriptional regulator GcvA [Casimicrobiaceae bacterium]|nr:transcriptional regulator GcvA [Casimicrobiaceae bacterium]
MPKPAPKARQRLPSLDLLKGFEAAARHLSFTRAAEELFLTQSALSRQMQALEEQLGLPLFERRHRQLLLTEAGQVLHAAAKSVLDEIGQTVATIRRDRAATPLTVSTNQPFASLWLIPRLARFRERHPDVDVYISADNRIVDLERENIDLAVRYCGEASAPPGSVRLFGERLVPVCSPVLASDRARPLKRPEDLRHHVLLHIDDERGRFPWLNWSAWLAAIGIGRLTPAGSLRFNHFDQVIQAAVDGQGVALGREPLIDRLLRQRKLVAPFPDRYATPRAYYIVRSTHAALRPEAQAFGEWLQEEARADVAGDAAALARPSTKRAR